MASVIGAGSAALRKAISEPLARRKRKAHVLGDGEQASLASDSIDAIIESEILPRLLMAHSSSGATPGRGSAHEIDALDASRFASMPLHAEAAELLEEVDAYLAEGVSVEAIYIDLLAPAARKLGSLWEADECDFVDVTMGLWRLQEVMREIAVRSPPVVRALSAPRSILLAPIPGDQHSFGAIMLDDVFARAGWRSEVLVEPGRRELLSRAGQKSFDVVGLTISRDCPSAAITHMINALRSVAVNPQMRVLIGGRVVNDNPDLVAEVGADGTALDARAAVEIAEQLVREAITSVHQTQ